MSRLKDLVYAAHREAAANNDNASSTLIRAAAGLGVPFLQAVTMAISSLGAKHGPIEASRQLIMKHDPCVTMRAMWQRGERVPGFGNSFFKDSIDPAWKPVNDFIRAEHGKLLDLMVAELERLSGRALYPNAAMFTAIYCASENLPSGTEIGVFIEARLPVWASIYHHEKEKTWAQ